jgi:hypothetical protein
VNAAKGTTAGRTVALLALGVCIVGAVLIGYRRSSDVGYVQINTVPAAPLTQTALYLDSIRIDPIRQGSALLRQHVGTVTLQALALGGAVVPICTIEVKRDRVTTVTVSVLERPPRCQCRYGGTSADHTCVS